MNHGPTDFISTLDASRGAVDLNVAPVCLTPSQASWHDKVQEITEALQNRDSQQVLPFTPEFGGSNQRRFSRCQLTEDQSPAQLIINGRTYDGHLAEISIGGFGVALDEQINLRVGAEGEFVAAGLKYVVGVTRVEVRREGTFVGLRQVREVIDRQHLPGDPLPMVRNFVGAIAGMVIVAATYILMHGR